MRIFFKISLLLLPALANAQLGHIDSLKNAFNNAPDGRLKFKAASNVYFYYQELNRDSALFYTEQQLMIARRNHNKIAEGVALVSKSYQLMGLGKYAESLNCLQQAFLIAEDKANEKEERWDYFLTPFSGNSRLLLLSYTHHMYALLMLSTENLEQQIFHFKMAGQIAKEINYLPRIQLAYLNLGQSYLDAKKPDSALYYEKEAEKTALQADDKNFTVALARAYLGTVQMEMGDIYKALGNDSMSLDYYYRSLQTATINNNRTTLSRVCLRLSRYYIQKENKDSALYYSVKNLAILKTLGLVAGNETNLGLGYENVFLSYQMKNQFDSAFKYQGLALTTKDSLSKIRIRNLAEFQKLTYSEQLRLQNLEKEKVVYRNKIRTYFMLAGIGVLLMLAIIFYRNNRQKHQAKLEIEKAYENLKATQQQLIQSEKMASLGELTAGIAHEIQNPLNFVNNFSEVSTELIDEMTNELAIGNKQSAIDIAGDVKQNLEKIIHHGKRADAIVKGMLQHSRTSSGQKEPTDINALADEYLRLAYHGFRAKDKSFNARFETELDKTIGKVNVVPQDIGRVLLNLINNAFYTADEKKRVLNGTFEPCVSITTRNLADKVEVRVRDNGNGIPQKAMEKIFQPFFTTKPTGQGTGLGLSLSYDIITKGHGGVLKVETKEGEGSEFIIQLPNTAS
jgi:signal transduction histidine kinase